MNQTVAPDSGKVWIQLTDDEIKNHIIDNNNKL